MSGRLDGLALRRQRLIARAAEQRAALAASGTALLPPARLADRLLSLTRVAQAHPAWTVAAAAVGGVLIIRRRRAARWLGRVWMAWRAWQAARVWLRTPASD
jgi:hypothetical protein